MCHAKSLQEAIDEKKINEEALLAEIERVKSNLKNTEQNALDYINAHTNGIIIAEETGKPEIFISNNKAFSKYSEDFSLDALDEAVDKIVDTAKDSIKVGMTEGTNPEDITNLIGSIGGVIKAGLALAATSSSTTTDIETTFCQFNVGGKNYAVYNGINSGKTTSSNAWENKTITVLSQYTIMARVKADVNLSNEENLQNDLNHLTKLKSRLNKMEEDSMFSDEDKDFTKANKFIEEAEKNITRDREKIAETMAH